MWGKIGIVLYSLGGIGAIVLYLLGLSGGYFRFLSPDKAFLLYTIAMLLSVVIVLAGLFDAQRNGTSAKTIVLLLALIPMVNLVYLLVEGRNYPLINDVSTDLVHPPEFKAALKVSENSDQSFKFPLEFKKDIEEVYPDLTPLAVTNMSVDDAHVKTVEVINGLSNWELTSNTIGARETIIEFTITSTVFGFVDDCVIRIQKPGGGAGCVVDMRSRSRMGKGDFGQNAEHIREFMGLLQ